MLIRKLRRPGLFAAVALVAAWGATSAPRASAETLYEAMAEAYAGNPTLRAERARQRATDEQVPQALSGWRPQVFARGEIGSVFEKVFDQNVDAQRQTNATQTNPASLSLTLTQPIFQGFRTLEQKRAAEATVRAGRQQLLAVEQQVLLQTASAYISVVSNRKIVTLLLQNVSALQQQLDAAQTRFDVGEVTRTDVAQARARLSDARRFVADARADLSDSIASYVRVVGHAPGTLQYPRLAKRPKTLDEAIALSERINPTVLSATFVERAARAAIGIERSAQLPQVSVQVAGTLQTNDLNPTTHHTRNFLNQVVKVEDPFRDTGEVAVTGVVSVPLYQGGRVASAVREAKQVASQRRIEIIETRRQVRELVASTWGQMEAAVQKIAAAKASVSAASVALEGVRQEYLVGSRTTLDVLDQQLELVNARVALVRAEQEQVFFSYQLLASVGRLSALYLELDVDYYDATENYRNVRDKWWGNGANTIK